jgi:hypothetical protein
MEKEYGDLYYLELKDLIPCKRRLAKNQQEFVNFYISKLNVFVEEDPLIVFSPMDSKTLGSLILDIIIEYGRPGSY